MKRLIRAACLLMILGSFVASTNLVIADDSLETLSAGALYGRFFDDMDKIKSANFEAESLLEAYVGKSRKPTYQSYLMAQGRAVDDGTKYGQVDSEVYYSVLDEGGGVEYEMGLVVKSNAAYVNFPLAERVVGKQWFEVPHDKYKKLGEAFELTPMFEFAFPETSEGVSDNVTKKIDLAKKHNIYEHGSVSIKDGIKVPNATRFNLFLNPDNLPAYFKEYSQLFSGSVGERLKEVNLSAGDEDHLRSVVENSYISLWFDNQTKLPVMYVEAMSVPQRAFIPRLVVVRVLKFENINKPQIVNSPKMWRSLTELVKHFDLKIDGVVSTPESELQTMINAYSESVAKEDKEFYSYLTANAYWNVGNLVEAGRYFKISSDFSKNKSANYYEALAHAEWVSGNTQKAKEYFQLALKKAPKSELILNRYGFFLLGLEKKSVSAQDLQEALFINKRLTTRYPTDDGLINLYLNYILLGDRVAADELVRKFSNFNTGINHNLIARAYHRQGNSQMSAHHGKLAKDLGYKQTFVDTEYFALSF